MKSDRLLKDRSRRLRRDQTPAEARLWHELRNRRFAGYKFRRQHGIGPFIADFSCAEARLVIELDGESHLGRAEHDERRQTWLESEDLKVLRLFNNDIPANLDEMMDCIFRECRARTSPADSETPHPRPLSPGGRGEAGGGLEQRHPAPRGRA